MIVYPVDSVDGVVIAPPSKSYTHRALFASLLACGDSRVVNPLFAGDTQATVKTVSALGGVVEMGEGEVRVSGVCGAPAGSGRIYCGGSGTTLRLATSIASLSGGRWVLDGDESLQGRPMGPLLEALRRLGVSAWSRDGRPPVVVLGPPRRGGTAVVDGSVSSQFVSSLLMAAPPGGFRISVVGETVSRPYIELTLRVMEAFGVRVSRKGNVFEPLDTVYESRVFRVPGDYSSASFMLAAGAIAGRVRVLGLDRGDVQADARILGILSVMGAHVRWLDDVVEVEGGSGVLRGVSVDLRDSPDLAPVVAVLGAYAEGVTRVRGARHLAFKESNRILSIARALGSLGVTVKPLEDGFLVEGGGVRGGRADSFGDHRIAMMLAVAALGASGPVEILGAERVGDSYPLFARDLAGLGARVEVVSG